MKALTLLTKDEWMTAAKNLGAPFDLVVIAFLIDPTHAGFYATGSKPALFVIQAIGLFYVSFLASYSAARATTPSVAAPLRRLSDTTQKASPRPSEREVSWRMRPT